MKTILILVSALLLTACTTNTNDRFYEEVWKPRPKTVVVQSTDSTPEPAAQEEEPEVKTRTIYIRSDSRNPVYHGIKYLDYTEKENRSELKELTGVDPVRIEWCAAFVNAILQETGVEGSSSVSENPLLARSFLDWGKSVDDPKMGDVVVFPRGNQGWQGHVGFYVKSQEIDGVLYYYILGGNQNNSVRVDLYRADKAIDIRRPNS